MQPEIKVRLLKYLSDALFAAEQVVENTFNIRLKDYHTSNVKWMVERGIEIISEALKRASVLENNLPLTDLNKIFATRNKIAHEYESLIHISCTISFRKAFLYSLKS